MTAEDSRLADHEAAEENASGDVISAATLPPGNVIARGPAGDCCILCGLVGIDLPLDHGCRPNIDVEAYRAQPKREVAL